MCRGRGRHRRCSRVRVRHFQGAFVCVRNLLLSRLTSFHGICARCAGNCIRV